MIHMLCDYCGRKIENGEDYYEFDDACICEDCVDEYVKDHRVTFEEEGDPRMEPEFWEDR